jgi:hypothetical protein
MNSDAEVIQFVETQARISRSDRKAIAARGESDPEPDCDSERLGEALTRNMPMVRQRIQTAPQSEWSLHDYLERLYKRLRNRLPATADLDHAIEATIKSLLHEDARNRTRRWTRLQSLDAQQRAISDQNALQFLTALVAQDKLTKFIDLLDPWTRMAFYAIHIDGDGVPRAIVAQRMRMKENSFNKRFQRGMNKARDRYITAYGQAY